MRWFGLETIELMWDAKLKLLLMITPRSRVDWRVLNKTPFNSKFSLGFETGLPVISKLPLLLAEIFNCHVLHHSTRESRALCISVLSHDLSHTSNVLRSSANNLECTFLSKTSGRSLINRRKRKGPKTLPCGTPLITSRERVTNTNCLLMVS